MYPTYDAPGRTISIPLTMLLVGLFGCKKNWPRGYKTFFMLNTIEHEIFHANKSQITNNAKFFLAKHSRA